MYMRVNHFDHVYKEPEVVNVVEIVKVASYFSTLIYKERNLWMYEEVTKHELLIVLSSFHKDKIPIPNG